MKYKVGDKVRIKSIDWYNRYTNGTEVNCKHYPFSCHMKKYCGQIMTISAVGGYSYSMIEDDGTYSWTDEMIECLVERNGKTYPYKIGDRVVLKGNNRYATITDLKYNSFGNLSYYIKIDNDKDICIDYPTDLLLPYDNMIERDNEDKIFSEGYNQGYEDGQHDMNEWVLPEGFQFKDENGNVINATKIILDKKNDKKEKFLRELSDLLNKYNIDSKMDMPDYVLAEYIWRTLFVNE